MDIPSLRKLGASASDFQWPTRYQDYLKICSDFREGVFHKLKSLNLDDSEKAALSSVIGQVLIDGESLLVKLLDIDRLKHNGTLPCFDVHSSPIFSFLDADQRAEQDEISRVFYILVGADDRATKRRKLRHFIIWWLTVISMICSKRNNRLDFQNSSGLLSDFLMGKLERVQFLRPESWPMPQSYPLSSRGEGIACVICSVFRSMGREQGFSEARVENASSLYRKLLQHKIQKSLAAVAWLDKSIVTKAIGGALVGGTPKLIGRLLGWFYRKAGKRVIRFSHGGDRVFFSDPLWPLTEFPFVSDYYVHGKEAAALLNARYDAWEGVLSDGVPTFKSIGSETHLRWVGASVGIKQTNPERPKVVFVPGSYLGERHFASLDFKLPDVLAADLQSKLIRCMLQDGFDVWIKPHPKGLFSLAESDEIDGANVLKGKFDPVEIEADCFVFDFAGSAFYDALSSNKGVVLIDTQHRPWDFSAKRELEKRCEIVPANFDDYNRLQVSDVELKQAIQTAIGNSGCSIEFATKFFAGMNHDND